jgi:transcriptional antiterminator NusG
MAKHWYVMHALSGHEYKVQSYIENNKKSKPSLDEKIAQVIVPTEEVLGLKAGKKVKSTRKILPSYILIEMEIDEETWSFINSVPGVTSFVGSGRKPVPLKQEEVDRVMNQMESKKGAESTGDVPYRVGDSVKVTSGPFSDFSGVVEQVNAERSKVRVIVSIFGRPTPIELDFLQIEQVQG